MSKLSEKAGYTAGEWEMQMPHVDESVDIATAEDKPFISLYSTFADARLISKAPELLEALVATLKELDTFYTDPMNILLKNIVEEATGLTWEEICND